MSSPGHGGKREGGGRKTEWTEKRKADLSREVIALFEDQAVRDLPAVYRAIKDAATGGVVVKAKVKFKDGTRKLIEREDEVEMSDGSVVYLYTMRPDMAAAKLFVEQTRGRAAVKQQEQQETTITLQHQVPRPRAERDG